MDFNSSKTKENLARAFAAECQAGARYQFMATQAQTESLLYVKDTMKLLAKNEMAHAKLFYDYIAEKCKGACKVKIAADYPFVAEGLENSLEQETDIEREEFEKIYPNFAKEAEAEGYADIAKSFTLVAEVEKTHAGILSMIYKGYKNGTLYSYQSKTLCRCSNCGHIEYAKQGWKKCPLCNFEQGAIMLNFSAVLQNCLQEK